MQQAIAAVSPAVIWRHHVEFGADFRNLYRTVSDFASREAFLRDAENDRARVCGSKPTCKQDAIWYFDLILCPPGQEGECEAVDTGLAIGWRTLAQYFEMEAGFMIDIIERANVPGVVMQKTLQEISRRQNWIRGALADAISGRPTSTQVAKAAHDRLTAMGAAATSAEQVRLADTRQTIFALEKVTATYQSDLNTLQPAYGDVAGRHEVYRATEAGVFAGISQIATQASTADLSALASLKVQLAAQSDNENRTPQLLILDAKRVQWDLANVQASYEAGLAPYTTYLAEKSLPVLDHTGAPRAGMSNVVAYAEGRIRRVNDAVRTIYDGIRRREAALSLAAADAITRDSVRAADAAQRESEFLDEITARVSDIWKLPPTGALNLPLQTERMTTMTAFLQLEGVCQNLNDAATWRAPGCQKVAAEATKIRTYLTQTLPFTLRFGVQKMRAAGTFAAEILTEIETKVTTGELVQAVHMYDATVSTGMGGLR
jgi:hypothetical protein